MNSQAYNVKKTCSRLGGISRKTFYELINAGDLKTFKIGKRRYASQAAISDFISRRETDEELHRSSSA